MKRIQKSLAPLAAFFLFGAGTGCSLSRVQPVECITDEQCPVGSTCMANVCVSPVDSGADITCDETAGPAALFMTRDNTVVRNDIATGDELILTDDGYAPRVSRSGGFVAFYRRAGDNTQVWLTNRDGTCARQLAEVASEELGPGTWTRSGAFVFPSGERCRRSLSRVDVDSGDITEVLAETGFELSELDIHPDGDRLLATHLNCSTSEQSIVAYAFDDDLVQGSAEDIVAVAEPGDPSSARWNADGSRIAYVVTASATRMRVLDMTSALDLDVARGTDPVWGPTGNVLFAIDTNEVFQFTVDGGDRDRITQNSNTDAQLDFSAGDDACPRGQVREAECVDCNTADFCGTDCGLCVGDATCAEPDRPSSMACRIIRDRPVIDAVTPNAILAGGGGAFLTITGSNFLDGSFVLFADQRIDATFVSDAELSVTVPGNLTQTATTVDVVVALPPPGDEESDPVNLVINNPEPQLFDISPRSIAAGSAAFTITATGAGFSAASQLVFDGQTVATTVVSGTLLRATIPANLVVTATALDVLVMNPAPGGGMSATQAFVVIDPNQLLINSVNPSSAVRGSEQVITISGTGFTQSSMVRVSGTIIPTTFISAQQLQATLPTTVTVDSRNLGVAVVNGGNTSNVQIFAVFNPDPVLTTVMPAMVNQGTNGVTLTLTGNAFVPEATVLFGGTTVTATVVSTTEIRAIIPANLLVTPGLVNVVVNHPPIVRNLSPNGADSTAFPFTIINTTPTPFINNVSPRSTTAGSGPTTLTIDGTGFIAASQVQFDGVTVPTTLVNGTQLSAEVPASSLTTARTVFVLVVNPGNLASNAVSFSVNMVVLNPTPVATTLSPTFGTAGASSVLIFVEGTDFVPNSTATFNGVPVMVNFVSSTGLLLTVDGALLGTAGVFPIRIQNPPPGGGTSQALNFAVNNPEPSVINLMPNMTAAGGGAFSIVVNGSDFAPGAEIRFGGQVVATNRISSMVLQAMIPANLIANAGIVSVTVTNPPPGGGPSIPLSFDVMGNNPVPVFTEMVPTSENSGSPDRVLTVRGSDFVADSVVRFNGTDLTTNFVTDGNLVATIPAALLATPGSFVVTVFSPGPGGGTSVPMTFTVN